MKRILAVLLSVLLLIEMLSISAFAADSKVNFTVEGSATAERGDELTFHVYLSSDVPLTGFEFYLSIPEGMTLVSESAVINPEFKTTTGCDGDFSFEEEGTEGVGYIICGSTVEMTIPTKYQLISFKLAVADNAAYQNSNVGVRDIIVLDENWDVLDDADIAASAVTVNVVPTPVPATGITLDETSVTLDKGAAETLTATVSPETATDSVTWTSDNETVATVADGVVTAVKCGTAKITAAAGSVSASCTVTVNHTFDQKNTDDKFLCTEATCTAPAVYCLSCECGEKGTETFVDEGSELGHDLTHHDGKDATCTESGWDAYDTCSRCDYTTYKEIAALGHDLLHYEEADPTCTLPGHKAYDKCQRCDYTTYEEIPATGHRWGEWVTVKAATEEEEGLEERYCTADGCEAHESREIPKLEHVHKYNAVATEPTCTEDGYTTYTCACGDTYTDDVVPALGHDFNGAWIDDENGHYHKCSRCSETDAAEAHVYGEHSCDEIAVCSVCGHKKAAGEHIWDDPVVDLEPTCEDMGRYIYTCTVCGEFKYEDISALGHDLTHHDGKDATCTESGWDAYDTCSRCDYTTYKEIPALGHDLTHHDGKKPTCTDIGWDAYDTCSRCGYTTYEEIPALGHTEGEPIVTKDPTCTEAGETLIKCTECGKELAVGEIPALGHDWGAGIVTTEPTCTDKGEMTYTCSRDGCDAEKTEEIPALGHDWGEWNTVKEAEVGVEGLEERVCGRCGETETRTIPALDDDEPDEPWYPGDHRTHKDNDYESISAAMEYYARLKRAEDIKRAAQETAITEEAAEEEIFVDAWNNPFGDIFESDSYYDAIEFVCKSGLFKGVSETAFAPLSTMTRAMFVTVLGRMAGVDEDLYSEVTFEDVAPGEWYTPYVVWAQENGIVKGYSDVKFGVNDEITVEQAAVIIARFAEFAGYDTVVENEIENEELISDWALAAMRWTITEGILPDGYLPAEDAPRALVAVMLYNFAGWCEE